MLRALVDADAGVGYHLLINLPIDNTARATVMSTANQCGLRNQT